MRMTSVPVAGSARLRRTVIVPLIISMIFMTLLPLLSACEKGEGEASGSYKPVFLPVTISWNGREWAVQGDAAIMTPIGMFSIGAKYKLDRLKRDDVRIIM